MNKYTSRFIVPVLTAAAGLGFLVNASEAKERKSSLEQKADIAHVASTQPTQPYKNKLVEDLIKQEGERQWVYDDKTGKRIYPGKKAVGKRTIGVGFNLEKSDARKKMKEVGADFNPVYQGKKWVTKEQIYSLLDKDIMTATNDARNYLGNENFERLDINAKEVIVNMAFNLGYSRLSKFGNLKTALINRDYAGAADAMKDSQWYKQVKGRAVDLVNRMNNIKSK